LGYAAKYPSFRWGLTGCFLDVHNQKPHIVKFPDKCEWQFGLNSDNKGGLVWHTDGSKTNKGIAAGVCRWGSRKGHSISLGLPTMAFQAEICAIKASVMENIEKGYTGVIICQGP
jgi:hypothetical protein